ncbi:hypothetical protein [Undibacterium sp. TS12]|uniref:hypothetical protein n=1 Tax=Undibacterium sp. TS12 TaxID=2908202 RepID=UPI001F4C8772|nr:hypothetical protein [Undibacterium sp. TS12]MCH8622560.1 hypothetical protein [Undibacterium sp. TS12]
MIEIMRESTWEIVYQKMLLILSTRGKNDAFGDGDFWLVDDDWGANQQKVCIFNPEFLTLKLVDDLKNILRKNALNWSIIVTLEIPDVPPEGVIISDSSVEYLWDLVVLRKKLGNCFYHTPKAEIR